MRCVPVVEVIGPRGRPARLRPFASVGRAALNRRAPGLSPTSAWQTRSRRRRPGPPNGCKPAAWAMGTRRARPQSARVDAERWCGPWLRPHRRHSPRRL